MPWPEKQRVAIYLDVKRRKGEDAAKALMHEAGYGGKAGKLKPAPNRRRKTPAGR